MNAQNSVVRFHHCCCNLGACPYSERDLGLLTIVNRQTLQHQASESRSSTTTDSIVDHESLKASAVVSQLADAIQYQVDDLFTDGVMPTGKIIRRIFLSRDQLLWMEELAVGACAHLIHDSGLQVDHDTARNMLSSTSLREECVKRVVPSSNRLIAWHLTVGLNTVF